MTLQVTLRTYVCNETACPDLEEAIEVIRGDVETGDVLGEIENDFTIQFNLQSYVVFVQEAMESTRDQLVSELPLNQQDIAELTLNTIIASYSFRVGQWLGSPTALSDPNERQRVWDEISRYRNEYVQAVNDLIDGAASQFEKDLDEEASEALKRLVVAFVTDEAHDPVFLVGDEDPFISTSVATKNYAREGIIVHPGYRASGGEEGDRSLVTVIAQICTPDLCPEPEEIDKVFELSCPLNLTGFRDSRPTLTIQWRLPKCCPVAIGEYTVLNPPDGILTGERIEFIGGNVSYEWLLWPGRGWFLTQYNFTITAIPMPGATQLALEARSKDGTSQATGLARIFSKQMLVTTISSITGEGDERVIKVNDHSGDFKPTDWFDYQVGEQVIVFGVGQEFDLPLTESSTLGGSKLRIIPANFDGYGV